MKPTVMGGVQTVGTSYQPTTTLQPELVMQMPVRMPDNFPVALTEAQAGIVAQNLAAVHFNSVTTREIVTLGQDTEVALHRTLDGFLSRIDRGNDPKIFELVKRLKETVAQEDLPALADRILNGKPGFLDRVRGLFFNKKALAKAMDDMWEETKRLAVGKTKTLVDVMHVMERDLKTEQAKLDAEIRSMEQLKNAYRERFSDFVVTTAFMMALLEESRAFVLQEESSADMNDPVQKTRIEELRDKLQALESRALALEGTLTRLPADQLVIRQLQNAGISILQETATTASARFGSIKMTLITIHSALVARGVQQLEQEGAALDVNLTHVRNALTKDVVTKAVNAPGNNRLAQAEQLKGIVKSTEELVAIVEQARADNQTKFAQARTMFADARRDMLALGAHIRPDQDLKTF